MKRQERPVVHFGCIDEYSHFTSIHYLTNYYSDKYKDNVEMYREIEQFE